MLIIQLTVRVYVRWILPRLKLKDIATPFLLLGFWKCRISKHHSTLCRILVEKAWLIFSYVYVYVDLHCRFDLNGYPLSFSTSLFFSNSFDMPHYFSFYYSISVSIFSLSTSFSFSLSLYEFPSYIFFLSVSLTLHFSLFPCLYLSLHMFLSLFFSLFLFMCLSHSLLHFCLFLSVFKSLSFSLSLFKKSIQVSRFLALLICFSLFLFPFLLLFISLLV